MLLEKFLFLLKSCIYKKGETTTELKWINKIKRGDIGVTTACFYCENLLKSIEVFDLIRASGS